MGFLLHDIEVYDGCEAMRVEVEMVMRKCPQMHLIRYANPTTGER